MINLFYKIRNVVYRNYFVDRRYVVNFNFFLYLDLKVEKLFIDFIFWE